ncbi:MAG: hypothetical protein K9H64_21900 [Bacteroidales bacterium]|nr:hypothetical protein [Bacteroidales bacterium]MCF8458686.1 hypothetical protein [Bacteroidales bacterium]
MRHFLLRGIIYFTLAFVGLGVLAHIRVSPWFIKFGDDRKGGWMKVYERINRSKQTGNFKRVYIGDSVGNQLFNFDSVPNSLCSNAAVSIAGNYILVENLIESNPKIEEIILVSVPNDIGWNFEQKLTHNNFVKPFLSFRNLKYFEPLLRDKLWEKPASWLFLSYAVKILPLSDVDFSQNNDQSVSYLEEIKLTTLSDIAVLYLKKLDRLCQENQIKLTIVSPPVPLHWQSDTNDWAEMRAQIESLGLKSIFKSYLDEIDYYPDDNFQDGLHLKEKFIAKARQELIQRIE